MTSYWDLYIAYVRECEKLNRANGIDPHHYEMEWNHTLPQCLFGDLPFGQFLTLKQHAIASALQTLTFRRWCLMGWMKKQVPEWMWEESLRVCNKELKQRQRRGGLTQRRESKGIFSSDVVMKRSHYGHLGGTFTRDNGLGIFGLTPEQEEKRRINLAAAQRAKAPEVKLRASKLGGQAATKEKDENGKSIHAKKMAVIRFEDPDHPELGKTNAGNLVRMQMRRGFPHGPENRRRVE